MYHDCSTNPFKRKAARPVREARLESDHLNDSFTEEGALNAPPDFLDREADIGDDMHLDAAIDHGLFERSGHRFIGFESLGESVGIVVVASRPWIRQYAAHAFLDGRIEPDRAEVEAAIADKGQKSVELRQRTDHSVEHDAAIAAMPHEPELRLPDGEPIVDERAALQARELSQDVRVSRRIFQMSKMVSHLESRQSVALCQALRLASFSAALPAAKNLAGFPWMHSKYSWSGG